MKKYGKWIAGVLALVVLIGGVYFLSSWLGDNAGGLVSDMPQESKSDSETGNEEQEQKRYAAPDFTVIDYAGNEVKLSDMKGKPVVVNFWASWCPPCKEEMPDFEDVYKKVGDDVTFMMVNMTDGQQETLAKAKQHIEDNGYTFPVYFDTELEAAYAYSVTSIPTTYFVDAEGNLVAHATGMINAETLEKGIGMITE